MKQSRLADIAARTGVTVPTVSKVLNGRPDVAPATRARILRLLDEAGYERKSSDAESRNKIAGFVDVVMNPVGKTWAAEVLAGVQHAASAANCDVVATYLYEEKTTDWVERIVRRGSRAVVIERLGLSENQAKALSEARIPCLIIDPGEAAPAGVHSISATNWAGGYAAAQHLTDLGHTEIAVIDGGYELLSSRARVDGFRSGLESAGIDLNPERVLHSDWSRAGARAEAEKLLAAPDRPSAIFAVSDRMAAGVMEAARAANVRIPQDLSVIGFDDLPEVRWLSPGLTTIRQPVEEMGRTALELLLLRSSSAEGKSRHLELATSLVVRESTAGPASRS